MPNKIIHAKVTRDKCREKKVHHEDDNNTERLNSKKS